jgi:hypothetical protein
MKISIGTIFSLLIFFQFFLVRADTPKPTDAEGNELMAIIKTINHKTLPYKAAAMQRMLTEANYFADRLRLPTPHPILMSDVQHPFIFDPGHSIINETNYPYFPDTIFGRDICNTNIPREQRIHALKIGVNGALETTNFEFSFIQGKLCDVQRLIKHGVERYADNLDALVGQPSLIDTNGAYQLATQWLAAVDIDMSALNKLKWTVNQLHYKPLGATNYVTLPLFYVDFGNQHFPARGESKAFDEPLVSVEILGTTKELQEMLFVHGLSFSRRPTMLITNILELTRAPDLPEKRLSTSSNRETDSHLPPTRLK